MGFNSGFKGLSGPQALSNNYYDWNSCCYYSHYISFPQRPWTNTAAQLSSLKPHELLSLYIRIFYANNQRIRCPAVWVCRKVKHELTALRRTKRFAFA